MAPALKRTLAGGLLAAFLVPTFLTECGFPQTSSSVYARVNGAAVTATDVKTRLSIYQLADPAHASSIGASATLSSVVSRLVDERILLDQAKKEKVAATSSGVKSAYDEVNRQLVSGVYRTGGSLQSAEGRLGLTTTDLMTFARTESTIALLLRKDVPSSSVSDAAVSAYYSVNQKNYQVPATVHLQGIRVATQADAKTVLGLLQKGASFSGLAKLHSLDASSKDQGGDLGWLSPTTLDPAIPKAILTLKTGQTSGIVKTAQGYAIVKVLGTRPARPMTEAEAAPEIRSLLAAQAEASAVNGYTAALKAHARISVTLPNNA